MSFVEGGYFVLLVVVVKWQPVVLQVDFDTKETHC